MDPATHPFDPGRALAVVRQVVSSPDPATGGPRGLVSSHSVARGLAEHYGSWALGWYRNVDQDPCSGALIRKPLGDIAGDLDAQVQEYTGILLEWRSWLEELAALFAESAPETHADAGEEERRRSRERGVAPVAARVVERTDAGELWGLARRPGCGRSGPIRGRRDGVLAAAALWDKPGETRRDDGLRAAWQRAPDDATAGEVLGFRLLQEWQKLVPGLPEIRFRTLPAFAKGGRERYGLSAETPSLFDACPAESASPGVPLTARAARLYLDVCFFHPFHDGNGRAALLALGFVLAQEDILLDEVGPIQIRRYADDPVGAASLARIIHTLAVVTGRRGRFSRTPAG
ncbi:Fic family protein [Streptomyces sp. WP-1]|uniref:Fic family protein n=1 Tax=Streptomyces sp. WP-1 TaxID=3041497 RepID=UPI002648A923|nr:Fic family protein [Streptomyces sp. WP-1]WKE71978.1 Fic family protein [Streptomyces sp. WP-1]